MIILIVLASLGAIFSCYARFIERQVQQDPNYVPACDVSDAISCSKPIKSPYSTLIMGSNARAGMVVYSCMVVFALFDYLKPLALLAGLSCLASLVLAYLLYFKIRSFCLVCTVLYCINIAIACIAFKAIFI